MNIIVHLPTNEMQINNLKKAVADIHSEKIFSYLKSANLTVSDIEKINSLMRADDKI